MTTDENLLRNKPQQERSLKRFNHILDTAAALFEAQGYDAVTTNHIADAAEVSIGSLYRFFPNKESVLQALIERYSAAMQAVFPEDVQPPRKIPAILDEMFANLAQFEATHASFQTIFLSLDAAISKEQIIRGDIVAWVEKLLAAHFPQLAAEKIHLCAEIGVGIVKGLMPLSEPPSSLPAQFVIMETRHVILAYLRDFLEREGIYVASFD